MLHSGFNCFLKTGICVSQTEIKDNVGGCCLCNDITAGSYHNCVILHWESKALTHVLRGDGGSTECL